jgi:hypothetical protein
MGAGGFSPEVKRRGMKLTTHLQLVLKSKVWVQNVNILFFNANILDQ